MNASHSPNTPKARVARLLGALKEGDVPLLTSLLHPDYIQHNPGIPSGRDAFLGLIPVLKQHGTHADTVRLFADGDYVIAHNQWRNAAPFGAEEMVAFDILRVDDEGRIAEHWDAMMPQRPANAAGRTLVDGPAEVTDRDATEANRARVRALFEVLTGGTPDEKVAAFSEYFAPDFHQHNPDAGDGISGFFEAVQSGSLDFSFEKQHRVFAEGNFVLSVSEGVHRGKPAVFYDLLRFERGRIVEHWDVIQDIPAEAANDNTMFGFA